ncbi:MAG: hypothetical protein HY040_15400 [Planctomycetes bacterium]|nr:hypothetical protein [Planctomycetota bacterium]
MLDWEELRSFWQNLSPETLAALKAGCTMVVALVAGHVLGAMVARGLRERNFDAALRMPGSSLSEANADHGITPTFVAGILVRLSVWAGAVWWLAFHYGRVEIANSLAVILSRTWAVAGLLVAALALGSVFARRLIDCLGQTTVGTDPSPQRNGIAASHRIGNGIPTPTPNTLTPNLAGAGAIGAAAYFLVVLLVLLIAADYFDWPIARSATLALWQLAQNLLIAGAALLVGYAGARAARKMATAEAVVSPEQRAGQYTALGIVAATTVLAMGVLLSSSGVLIGLAVVAILAFALWLARDYLPDISAGLQLRTNKVREVWFDGEPWQLADIGFLTSQVTRSGAVHRVQNRLALEARFHGAPSEPVAR